MSSLAEYTDVHFSWPEGFCRVPDEDWTHQAVDRLALKYDTVEDHGWYRNLDRTVRDLRTYLQPGHLVMDYSGGTGILAARLLEEIPERRFGILIVDSSPKFLRLALEKLGRHRRIAFRLIRYLKKERRLQLVEDVLDSTLLERGVDAVISTNAIHLYTISWKPCDRGTAYSERADESSSNRGTSVCLTCPPARGSSTRPWRRCTGRP